MTTVAEIGEAGLLAALESLLGEPGDGLEVAVGDDAAIFSPLGKKRPRPVLCCDAMVEGVHFRRSWASFSDIGHKLAAVNLSDLAAMGAKPLGLVLSMALGGDEKVTEVMALVRAVAHEAQGAGARLAGGDISAIDGPMVLSVSALGKVDRGVLRHGGQPGDVLMVSGSVGNAAAGLRILESLGHRPAHLNRLVRAQLRPEHRCDLALAVAPCVRSMADISDGLLDAVALVLGAGYGARIDSARIPVSRALSAFAQKLHRDPLAFALFGGEDFELMMAVAPEHVDRVLSLGKAAGHRLHAIGTVQEEAGIDVDGHRLKARDAVGYRHFGSDRRASKGPRNV